MNSEENVKRHPQLLEFPSNPRQTFAETKEVSMRDLHKRQREVERFRTRVVGEREKRDG